MILFQKTLKSLFTAWVLLFCSFVFSDTPFLNPLLFSPPAVPSAVVLSPKTPVPLLCPPGIPPQICMAATSFPLIKMDKQTASIPKMYTPTIYQAKPLSLEKIKRMLAQNKWRSYRYSQDSNRFRVLSKKDRNTRPTENYYRIHIQEDQQENAPAQVIQEESVDGQQNHHVGELRGVSTADILRAVESAFAPSGSPTQPPEQTETEPKTEEPITLDTPVEAIALNYNSIPKQCLDAEDAKTEAVSMCINCSEQINNKLKQSSTKLLGANFNPIFNSKLSAKINNTICHPSSMSGVKSNFEKSCGNISFENYISKVLVCESCENKIPPALMLAMMSLESSGRCPSAGDDSKSRGLFQINTAYHKDPPACSAKQTKQIQTASLEKLRSDLQCLDNPVANLKKSIDILKNFHKTTNKSNSNFDCQSPDMNTQQTDQWRKALASYNGGDRHIKWMKYKRRPTAIPYGQWTKMSDWEKMRVQYFFYKTASPRVRMGNLAHTEAALGGVGTPEGRLNLFNFWKEALGNKIDLSQCP